MMGARSERPEPITTRLHYRRRPGSAWQSYVSRHSADEIHMAVGDADLLTQDDGTIVAVGVLDLPEFHALRVGGEQWDAVDDVWESEDDHD
jgi:hypothetical protein